MISSGDQTILQTTTGQKTKPRWPQQTLAPPYQCDADLRLLCGKKHQPDTEKEQQQSVHLLAGCNSSLLHRMHVHLGDSVCVSTRPVGCVVSRKGYLLNRFKPLIQQSRAPHDESMIPSPARAVSSILPSSASISNPCCHPSPPILINVE